MQPSSESARPMMLATCHEIACAATHSDPAHNSIHASKPARVAASPCWHLRQRNNGGAVVLAELRPIACLPADMTRSANSFFLLAKELSAVRQQKTLVYRSDDFLFGCSANTSLRHSNGPNVLSTNGFGAKCCPELCWKQPYFAGFSTKTDFPPGAQKKPGRAGIG
jgi:hypothetical protein